MQPKAKITKNMVIDAAFEVARKIGHRQQRRVKEDCRNREIRI